MNIFWDKTYNVERQAFNDKKINFKTKFDKFRLLMYTWEASRKNGGILCKKTSKWLFTKEEKK